jgi:formylglycine-generating enzyme required for sulfatase activity
LQSEEIVNSIGMKLVLIPAGKFLMGASWDEEGQVEDEYQHEVEITKPFYMGVYEVTQEEYEKVMGSNPGWFSARGSGRDKVRGLDTDRFPVEMVSWEDAVEFCRRLSDLPDERNQARLYRLPSEAQWEYACRAGARESLPFRSGRSLSAEQANFDGNYPYGGAAKGKNLERPTTVGSYKPNHFGLFDMHGNV